MKKQVHGGNFRKNTGTQVKHAGMRRTTVFSKYIRSRRKAEENGAHCPVRGRTYCQRTCETQCFFSPWLSVVKVCFLASRFPEPPNRTCRKVVQPLSGDGTGSAVILTRRP